MSSRMRQRDIAAIVALLILIWRGGPLAIGSAIALGFGGLAFYIHQQDAGMQEMVALCGVLSSIGIIVIILYLVYKLFSKISTSSGKRTAAGGRSSPWDMTLHEMAQASQAFYDFLRELNRSARCRKLLREFPGLEAMDGENHFTINQRLAAIVYCDLRDCFRRLGRQLDSLDNLEGMGYSMLVVQLLGKGFDLTRFFDRKQNRKFAEIVGELDHTVEVEIDIAEHEDEFRFAFLFGKANNEYEWVQRYSTHMYRWASLIAKADGTVTPEESKVLASIMDMKRPPRVEGNVRVNGSSSTSRVANPDVGGDTPDGQKRPNLKDSLSSLESLIGLAPVKDEIHKLISFIDIQKKRERSGLKSAPVSYHCVFTGNPGTGKTTVARIVAEIYRAMGIIKKGHLIETDRSGLVGEYVGQTAVKTNKIIDSALDGVLFIDEAYSLIQGGEKDFGIEAISTLLKRMEDDRDRLVVILAGYTDEMKRFIDSNPGLQSRFNRYIQFPDYNAEELAKIFMLYTDKSQYVCNEDVRNSIVTIMERSVAEKDRNFGNGRFVRNLFENAIQRQAVRLSTVAPLTSDMLAELTLHDLGFAYED